jgi:hypothetical protein
VARRALPGLLADIVQPLQQARAEQHDRLTVYQRTPIADEMADHAVVEMLRRGIIGVKAIPRVLRQWTAPRPHTRSVAGRPTMRRPGKRRSSVAIAIG